MKRTLVNLKRIIAAGMGLCLLLFLFEFTQPVTMMWVVAIGLMVMAVVMGLLQPKKSPALPKFPRSLALKLERGLMVEAVPLYRQWLLPGLSQAFSETQTPVWCEAFANAVCQAIKAVPSELWYQSFETRSRDHAALTLIFLTIYLRLRAMNLSTQQVSPYRDPLKQFPWEVAKTHLFRESFRLLELGQCVAGKFDNLQFNQDIQLILANALSEKTAPSELENQTTPTPAEAKPKVTTQPACKTTQIPVEAKPKQVIPPASGNDKKSPFVSAVKSQTQDTSKVIKKFDRWLTQQLKRQPINTGSFFFVHANFQTQLFLTDMALIDFTAKTQESKTDLINTLQLAKRSDGKCYQLKRANESSTDLVAIETPIDLNEAWLHPTNHTIEVKR